MNARVAHPEEVLHGGTTNAGLVTRVGDTVRRPQRPTSPATRALLDHLEHAGFDGAPRYLGVDERGREVLSYIPGRTAFGPDSEWALTDAALVSVAGLLRRYHDAVADFEPTGWTWPPPEVPADFRRPGLVSHNDPNLDNVVFDGEEAVALIDFDLAGPGSAAWDLACAARLWAPLRAAPDTPAVTHGQALERLARFADAYGASAAERAAMAGAMVACHDWCYAIVHRALAAGHVAFGLWWDEGGGARAYRTRRWLDRHEPELRGALGV